MTACCRRAFIGGAVALVAAPAIVRFDSIMPVRAMPDAEVLRRALNEQLYGDGFYAKLAAATRRAFIPRLYVQLWRANSPLAQLLDAQVRPPLLRCPTRISELTPLLSMTQLWQPPCA